MLRRFSAWACLAVSLSHTPLYAQCVTHSTYIYCTDCPTTQFNCWDSANFSYSVLGQKVETWCNLSTGQCPQTSACDDNSMVTAAQDCNGNILLYHGRICCFR